MPSSQPKPVQAPTSRSTDQRSLQERTAELESLFANAPVGLAFFDDEHRYLRINERLAEIHGLPVEAHIGRRISELLPINARVADPIVDEVFRTGRSVEQQITGETPKAPGVTRHWLTGFFPVFRDAPQPIAVGAYVIEVTDRIRAEEALRESEERFHNLADNISQLAWMADAKGWIFWYSRRWYEYTGTNLEEMQGWGWQAVHHPDHVQRVVDKVSHCFQTGEIWEDTFPLRGKDGSYRWFLSRAMPIRDESGKVLRWFGTNTDITEQRDAEQALRESEERLHAFVNASSDVVYRMNADWSEMRQLDGRGFISDTENPKKIGSITASTLTIRAKW